ncbi:MAG: FAD-binding protein, partial [Propionibacteriaceae bacterium]|nr:FAD-binding protein [Propionibacteriaceae bacterium]
EWQAIQEGRQVFLDARERPGQRFQRRFPVIFDICQSSGIDPRAELIPIRPAAHYHMGGVTVDEHGRTSVFGLFAAGEVSSTGLHGANRLASNSLLEAVVCGRRVGRYLRTHPVQALTGSDDFAAWFSRRKQRVPREFIDRLLGHATSPDARKEHVVIPGVTQVARPATLSLVRSRLSSEVGVLRDAAGLADAAAELSAHTADPSGLVAWLIARSALQRQESRGAHTRTDFPQTDARARHTLIRKEDDAS